MSAMQACPKCGGVSGYTVSDLVGGWEERWGDWSGAEEVSSQDGFRYRISKTVRCDDCRARVPRPDGSTRVRGLPTAPTPETRRLDNSHSTNTVGVSTDG